MLKGFRVKSNQSLKPEGGPFGAQATRETEQKYSTEASQNLQNHQLTHSTHQNLLQELCNHPAVQIPLYPSVVKLEGQVDGIPRDSNSAFVLPITHAHVEPLSMPSRVPADIRWGPHHRTKQTPALHTHHLQILRMDCSGTRTKACNESNNCIAAVRSREMWLLAKKALDAADK